MVRSLRVARFDCLVLANHVARSYLLVRLLQRGSLSLYGARNIQGSLSLGGAFMELGSLSTVGPLKFKGSLWN